MIQHATVPSNLPNHFLDDSSRIPGWQRRLHLYGEVAAILAIPRLFSAARDAGPKHKRFLTVLAWGTLLIDGYLVYNWLCDSRLKSQRQLVKRAQIMAATIKRPPPVGPGAPPAPIRTVKIVVGKPPRK